MIIKKWSNTNQNICLSEAKKEKNKTAELKIGIVNSRLVSDKTNTSMTFISFTNSSKFFIHSFIGRFGKWGGGQHYTSILVLTFHSNQKLIQNSCEILIWWMRVTEWVGAQMAFEQVKKDHINEDHHKNICKMMSVGRGAKHFFFFGWNISKGKNQWCVFGHQF